MLQFRTSAFFNMSGLLIQKKWLQKPINKLKLRIYQALILLAVSHLLLTRISLANQLINQHVHQYRILKITKIIYKKF